ncbi:F-box/RNI-like superfamily protein [Striga asiatica]|uniref:F-box/RNI-like superfamily protein n=1 Tax=Striga asiatica TaxID=4170 RepID=A0A5A7R7C7_STRAF|nr:F-box/RNI-like superfamily protein [Striga asiatica]
MASIDKLSALPDEIISHILSFLPFKATVSTSTLAVRWRRLWAYAPNIQLTGDSIYERTNFVRTLKNVLFQCEAHLANTLSLPMGYFNEHEIESCLESAFVCDVKILDLILPYRLNIMPLCVFTSKTLVDLRIECLHVEMKKGDVLISGCPVLEDLTLSYCLLGDGENVHCVSSPIMKRLVLHCDIPRALSYPSRLKIDTPALEYLVLRYIEPNNISIGIGSSTPYRRILYPDDIPIRLRTLIRMDQMGYPSFRWDTLHSDMKLCVKVDSSLMHCEIEMGRAAVAKLIPL